MKMEWRDIESAPKDGTPFLILMPDGRWGMAYIEPREYEGVSFNTTGAAICGPDPYNSNRASISLCQDYLDEAVAWMPLPEPSE